jgi:hypothetical protein
MPIDKTEQHRIILNGREFHFVAYEGVPANLRRSEPAVPPMWYLMTEGKRHPVMEHLTGQPVEELDSALRQWVEANAVGPVSPRQVRAQRRRDTADIRREDWWAPR